jgi:hypothetical protein
MFTETTNGRRRAVTLHGRQGTPTIAQQDGRNRAPCYGIIVGVEVKHLYLCQSTGQRFITITRDAGSPWRMQETVVVTIHGDDRDDSVQDDGVVIAVDVDAAAISTELHAVLIAVDQHALPATGGRPCHVIAVDLDLWRSSATADPCASRKPKVVTFDKHIDQLSHVSA